MNEFPYSNESELKPIIQSLSAPQSDSHMCHMHTGREPLLLQSELIEIIGLCREIIFPGFFSIHAVTAANLEAVIDEKCHRLHRLLQRQILAALAFDMKCDCDINALERQAADIALRFMKRLPELRATLYTDINAIYLGDPAAPGCEEVVYSYPSVRAITNYRLAHELLNEGVPVMPRFITECAHGETGIDIHPAAQIGHHFAIDHGTGVVIGATAIIGHHVKLYQGVTLGARSFDLDEDGNPVKGVPRHPIIGNHVIIYSNATILGRITIGDHAVIGGNIWVTEDVAPGKRIVQKRSAEV